MYTINESTIFTQWLLRLKDLRAKAKILIRIKRVKKGNLGDIAPVGEGVSEFRIFEGKGYRVYFVFSDPKSILLLCGGDKASQKKDVKLAKLLSKEQ